MQDWVRVAGVEKKAKCAKEEKQPIKTIISEKLTCFYEYITD